MSRDQRRSLPEFGLPTSPIESVPEEIVGFDRLGFDYVEIGIEQPNATPQILTSQKDEILSSVTEWHVHRRSYRVLDGDDVFLLGRRVPPISPSAMGHSPHGSDTG